MEETVLLQGWFFLNDILKRTEIIHLTYFVKTKKYLAHGMPVEMNVVKGAWLNN